MINLIKSLIVGVLILITGSLSAQELQGTAYYQTKRKVTIKLDSTSASTEQQEMINVMLKKQFEKEFVLDFNKTASTYKEVESLGDANSGASAQIRIETIGVGGGGKDILYKDTKEKTYTNQRESFSKQFLIKDSLQKRDWKLENETKQIGNYTCYKATFTREVKQRSLNFNDAEKKEETKKKTIVTTAWYTPQIPVSHGPSKHWGLPGLILEINDGSSLMICTKVVMNPKEKVEIVAPKKGKKVSRKEYDEIVKKKIEEMNKIYGGGAKKKGGQNIQIKIGG